MHTEALDIVVTAARASQARIYEALLAERAALGRLPPGARLRAVADPGGRRVGSGLATAAALRDLLGNAPSERALRGRRILVIHSGGDSRRLPAFLALGKTFAPLPARAGMPATTVFDLLVAELVATPLGPEGGVLIASGDTSVEINASLARDATTLDEAGVDGFAIEGSIAEATRHGVYLRGRGTGVRAFVQKPTRATLAAMGVTRAGRRPLIDIGALRLSPGAAIALLRGCGDRRRGLLRAALRGRSNPIDLYRHVLEALAPGSGSERRYVDSMGPATADEARGLCELHRALHGVPFRVHVVDRRRSRAGAFVHVGTTAQYLDQARRQGVAVIASEACAVRGGQGAPSAIVGSLGVRATCAGDNLIVGVPGGLSRCTLPRGVGLVCLPVGRRAWATVLFHVDDDGKTPFARGGTLLGRRLETWCREAGISQRDVATPDETTWDARLWALGRTPILPRWMVTRRPAPSAWKRAPRLSLREVAERIDPARVVALERRIARAARARRPEIGAPAGPADRIAFARDLARTAASLRRSRPKAAQRLLDRAFLSIGSMVTTSVELRDEPPAYAIPHDVAVWASAPARIDLAGGWSDTPPICNELGGTVVNAAIELDGRPPVHAIAKRSERAEISVHSVDLGRSATFRSTSALAAHGDPRDWTALAKAALRLSGIAPPSLDHRLDRWLARAGGGLSLSLFAAVPKGSGLGTSSILGAATLACLDRVCGITRDIDGLVRRTSALEQLIATRGGWQDQAGGIYGGCNLLRTAPGLDQMPRATALRAPPGFFEELRSRSVLCFTGERRLARDILQRVVERYLVDESTAATVRTMKSYADLMADAIRGGDVEAFSLLLERYWWHKVALDPHATSPTIESFVRLHARDVRAWSMPGAGGGGFIYLIAKSARGAERIRNGLTARPPNPRARVVPFRFTRRGLAVSTL